jgi:nucleotidyltransferase/DNA polymerase involved in DNA repair
MMACVRLPHFGPGIEQRDRPALAGKPLALVDETDHINDLSQGAMQAGVRLGMSVLQAQAVCGDLTLRPAAPARYRRAFGDLLATLTHFSAHVEPEEGLALRADARRRKHLTFLPRTQVDAVPAAVCYLDLGTLPAGETQTVARRLPPFVQERCGLPAAVGLAAGKFTARVAALLPKAGEGLAVLPDRSADFLATFTVALLPVDGETIRQLYLLGLDTLGDVAALPVTAVVDRFGREGRIMHRLAGGRDTSPVQRYMPPVMERAAHQFDDSVEDWTVLRAVLAKLTDALSARLRGAGQVARHVVVDLELADGSRLECDVMLRRPTASARSLLDTVYELAASLPVATGIADVELVVDDIGAPVARQLSLFEREPVSAAHLREVLASLVARYGDDCFYQARLVDGEARLPERRIQMEKVGRR